jgi:hypothetical protein
MNSDAANALIAEYESLREEFFARLESQRQAFNYLAVILAAMIALIGADRLPVDLAVLLLALPLVVAPLGFIFFDNELVIWGIAAYIRDTLRPQLTRLVGQKVLLYEGRFESHGSRLHLLLSTGRWLLFIVPTLLPIGYAAWNGTLNSWLTALPYMPFMMLDVFLFGVLGWAVYRAVCSRNQVWRQKTGEKRVGPSDRRGLMQSARALGRGRHYRPAAGLTNGSAAKP